MSLKRLTKVFLYVSLVEFSLCFITNGLTAEDKKLDENECWEIYYDFIAKTKPYGIPIDKQEHEKKIKPKIKFFRIVSYSNCIEYCAELGDEKNTFMLIDRCTGEVRNFMLTKIAYTYLAEFSQPIDKKPLLTYEKVKEIAKPYLSFVKSIKFDEYIVQGGFRHGFWTVSFQRALNGIPFGDDSLSVSYSEKYGVFVYTNTMISEECDTNPKITAEEAILLAKKHLPSVTKSDKNTISEAPKAKLLIVRPSMLKGSLPENISFKEIVKTLLVWRVIIFVNDNNAMTIFIIDAIDGKLLDFSLLPLDVGGK